MNRLAIFIGAALVGWLLVPSMEAAASHCVARGFDEFGYNYCARIFVEDADGVDRNLDGTVWGDPTFANDHLVMKWSKAWDDARFHGVSWSPDAWVTNEWAGMAPDGSETVWHYKIVWTGLCGADGTPLSDGSYCIWGQFKVIMDQGVDPAFCSPDKHCFNALATPNGLGGP